MVFWTAPRVRKEMDKAIQYVVYRFAPDERVDLRFAENIVAITRNTFIALPYEDGKTKYTYVVTALDRVQNESKGNQEKVKL